MDESGYDRITVGDDETVYRHAMGWDHFRTSLSDQFPESRDSILAYTDAISASIKSIPLYDLENAYTSNLEPEQLIGCTMEKLKLLTADRRLKTVLAGANSIYHGAAHRTPFYLHACIRNSFVASAWRIAGGSDQLAGALVEAFKAAGGTLFTDAKVTGLEFTGDDISAALLEDGRKFFGKQFISNMHPAVTLKLVPAEKVRRSYRQRIESLENSAGFFSIYLVFKPGFFPYQDFNHYHYYADRYFEDDLPAGHWPHTYLLHTPFYEDNGGFTRTASILSFMKYDDYKRWDGLKPEERGQDYHDFREMAAQKLLTEVEKRYPGLRGRIEKYFVSTPLTFSDYTGTPQGSGYGILKDCTDPVRTIIQPRTKIPNLFFTGQNLNIHGVIGTTINAILASAEFTGFRYLVEKITHA
jgi:all-trans-retinol 13,14-reductase